MRAHQEAWIARVGGRIGFDCHRVSARHIWHGDAKNRQYVTRDEILKRHHFDPERHIEPDPATGLLRWTNQAPTQLRHDLQTYFLGRREDGCTRHPPRAILWECTLTVKRSRTRREPSAQQRWLL